MSKRADGSYSRIWRGISKAILVPLLYGLIKHDWRGKEHFPRSGGMILAANHLSYADVLAVALYSYRAGRYPVFLAKSSLFDIPVLGYIVRKLGQLPVYRNATDAALVLKDAELGIRNGASVIFYPESTVTRDPAKWPMVAKTGAARLALSTGAPVVPVAHWGAQEILPYGSFRPHLLPRKTVRIVAGPPVDLSAFAGQPLTSQVLREATAVIMKDITGLLAGLRGETPPDEPFHPAIARRKARQELRALQEQNQDQGGTQDAADPGSTQATTT
ncbi:MAG TPA: lysophospholipid acyltransferase family protein [Streptosporangiaceae bacterium]|jgi:1-acyl-sn-glycerol-3-phosphate acyltransferase